MTGSYEDSIYYDLSENISSIPYSIINNGGYSWYMNPETKRFIRIGSGTEVVVVLDEYEKGKTLVRAERQFLLIPKNEIIEIGYN